MEITNLRKGVRIGVASIAAVMLAGVSFASANGTIRVINERTGQDSSTDADANITSLEDIDFTNAAFADNTANIIAGSGNNSADGNTEDGDVSSGNVRGNLNMRTVVNGGAGSWMLPASGGWSTEIGNNITGQDSIADADANIVHTRTVDTTNSATVDNTVTGAMTSGSNSSDGNTGNGRARSGSVSLTSSMTVDANANAGDTLRALGNGTATSGNHTVSNTATGQNSTASATLNLTQVTDVSELNTADVDNSIGMVLSSSGNSADGNTGDGTVDSGDVTFDIGVNNILN